MFFMLQIKTKKEIYNKLVDFRIWIENLSYQKIKYIYLEKKPRNNAFDT